MKRVALHICLCILGLGSVCLSADAQPLPPFEEYAALKAGFADPPRGYGNVPFYWWDGDSLKYERLVEQLSLLDDATTDGLSVSYIHTHPQVDVELNAHGYGSFGRADAGIPAFYSEEWWKLWNRFSGECARRGIGLGVDDYVVGWAGNGFYVDEVLQSEGFHNYQGRLYCRSYSVAAGERLEADVPEHTLLVVAYPGQTDLTDCVKSGKLEWTAPTGKDCKVFVISTTASPELHPDYGKRLVEAYFNRFEEKLDEQGRKGLNYFFQDELHYDLNLYSWCEDMRGEFLKRKGYDVLPYLPALWEHVGEVTPKIRLDYAQVVTELAEERYFKPIFDWHNERGLIYGCDNNGRGLEPLQYLDYFRAISWYTAPGNDAPARGSSYRQTKVSSSVTHLYDRPRTWLEAFHSMGWDSNGEWLTSQLDLHLIAGGNLLCLHGLYYSTHGGWWEWAPPCFHFRMPYWPHMKRWLKYAQRMCFLLSQGSHVCDIAVMYPTESLQAYPDAQVDNFWKVADLLGEHGLDYDFVDYQSLQRAEVDSGLLRMADEEYKILVLADMRAMHHETLQKIYDFYKRGGIVLAVGTLPEATTLTGEKNGGVNAMLQEMFGNNGRLLSDAGQMPEQITSLLAIPDFRTSDGKGRVLHRRVGNQDIYMVMNVRKGEEVFFRGKGRLECWNAKNGLCSQVPILRQTEQGTWIRYDAEYNESRLFVFSPGEAVYAGSEGPEFRLADETLLDGDWDVEFLPTMNNKWGDFRLPAADEWIGPEVRQFTYRFIPSVERFTADTEMETDSSAIYGYAPYLETVTLPDTVSWHLGHLSGIPDTTWEPYCYSWQYGVFDQPGSQGYHGLKGKVDNRFLILDKGGLQLFRTQVYVPADGVYQILQEGEKPGYCYLDGELLEAEKPVLTKGWHRLLLVYEHTPKGSYVLSEKKSNSIDTRKRSAVVFYPEGCPVPKENNPYDTIVAMKWYRTGHLPYSVQGGSRGEWAFRFQTAPGTERMTMKLKGKVRKLWIDGKQVSPRQLKQTATGTYALDFGKNYSSGICTVNMMVEPETGFVGAACFTEPVKLDCRGGKMPAGNWTDFGALKFYSGGVIYRKEIRMSEEASRMKTVLDLGGVNATCEVRINGKPVDVLMQSPYRLDISDWLVTGDNRLEVLVYSTLSNHYQTIPSAYRGEPVSGLLGPVKVQSYKAE